MTTNTDHASAQIIRFPARGRFAARQGEEQPAIIASASRVARVAMGGAWYHDEAIRGSERAGNS